MVEFTGRCPCGATLALAYWREHDHVFWNCFKCFPHFERAPVGFNVTDESLG